MINNLFTTPVYYSKIDEAVFTQLQIDTMEYIRDNQNLFTTNEWNCNTKTNIFCDRSKSFFPTYLNDLIIEHTSNFINEGEFINREFVVDDCWITLGEEGAYQEVHDHIGDGNSTNSFSGVLYVSIEENAGGEFVIQSPIDTLSKLLPKNTNDLLASQIHIEPTEGLILSFPCWLKHGTLQYKSNTKQRISISWNIIFK